MASASAGNHPSSGRRSAPPIVAWLLPLVAAAPASAYVTREPDLWQLGQNALPDLPAPEPLPVFPLVTAAGGPEDLGLPEFEPAEDTPRMRNFDRVRAKARDRLEAWLEEHGEEVLERRRAGVIQPGELVVGNGREDPERFFALDGTTTPRDVELAPATLDLVSAVFRYRGTDAQREMDPRLIALLSEASWFFQVPVTLVSGYRPRNVCTRRQSRHIYGAASDIKLSGIPMEVLADFFTVLSDGPYGPMGVGRYPRDGFVHVDSRDETYFWTGSSSRRRRHRTR